jgi:hypothetical protein
MSDPYDERRAYISRVSLKAMNVLCLYRSSHKNTPKVHRRSGFVPVLRKEALCLGCHQARTVSSIRSSVTSTFFFIVSFQLDGDSSVVQCNSEASLQAFDESFSSLVAELLASRFWFLS